MVYGDNFACSFTITHSGWGSQVSSMVWSKHPDGFTLHKRVAFLFYFLSVIGKGSFFLRSKNIKMNEKFKKKEDPGFCVIFL